MPSCYVTDNGDLMLLRQGLDILLPKLAKTIDLFARFAKETKDLACLSYTHGWRP